MNFADFKQEFFSFIYITTKDCNVCKVLHPKIKEIAEVYEKATFHYIDLDSHRNAAGFFMAFSVPTLLVYSNGNELLRVARHLDLNEIKIKLDKYYNLL